MRQVAPHAGAGTAHEGSLDLAKLEPAIAAPQWAPQWSNLTTRGFFAPVSRTAIGITINNLEIYETDTSN